MQGFLKPALMTLMMGTVAACSTPQIEMAGKTVKETDAVVGGLMTNSAQPLPKKAGAISVNNDVWLGGRGTRLKRGKPLPSAVETDGVTLSGYGPQDIQQIADLVQEATGIGVDITEDAISYTRGGQEGSIHNRTVTVDHTGKLSTFMDRVTSTMGLNWRYEDGRIVVFYLDTHTYVMKVLPSTNSVSMGISGGAGGDGGGGSSSQETSTEYEINLWGEIVEAVTGLVGEAGAITASRSTGTLSISAPTNVLAAVGKYVEEQNSRLAQQVAVNVQVFNVSMSDNAEMGTDFNMSFNDADIGAFGFTSELNAVAQAGSLGWQLLRPVSGIPDVSGIVRMLNSKGDVSVVTTANATTLNNVPMPIQVGNNRSYVSAVTEVEDESGGTSFDVVTSTVNTGFNMQLLPRIMSSGVVALQYNIATSELVGANDGFDQVTIDGNTIQLPNINSRAFTQQVMIPTGNTLVLSGFEQTTSRMDKTGLGSAENWLMGGRHSGSLEREVMVITITPVIVDAGRALERVGG